MSPGEEAIIEQIRQEIQSLFAGEGTGHDWHHIERVFRMSLILAGKENADTFICALGALLHDIADHKFHPDDLGKNQRDAKAMMQKYAVDEKSIKKVIQLIGEISYKGAGVATPVSTMEAACVQDADRLDAIGAIGIARAFAYGGSKGRPLYDPDKKPVLHKDFDSYRKDEGHTINHFYEKLLLLRNRMNTTEGKRIADERHAFMELWMARFFGEWEGRC